MLKIRSSASWPPVGPACITHQHHGGPARELLGAGANNVANFGDSVEVDKSPVSSPAFWDSLYAGGNDGWELGAASPPLIAWLEAGGRFASRDASRAPRVAIPGAGRGHDARALVRRGHHVWGFDFAAAAIREARALARDESQTVTYEQRDIFTLDTEYASFFDGVWEYTCFCAIDPARREEYARVMHAFRAPGGTLLACFFPLREGDQGPPFPVSRPGIERVLAPFFRIVENGPPAVSVEQRQGFEWLVRAERLA